MAEIDNIVREGLKETEELYRQYLEACLAMNDSRDRDDPAEVHRPYVDRAADAAQAMYMAIEDAIVRADVAGANLSALMAGDLAATAHNALDSIPDFYNRMRAERAALNDPIPEPSPMTFSTMQSFVSANRLDKNHRLQKRFEAMNLPIFGFKHPAPMNTRYSRKDWIVITSTGLALLLVVLVVALFYKDFNNFNLWVFRLVAALSAAMLAGTLLSGFLQIESQSGKNLLKAGGAVAFFVIVYYLNPPAFVVNTMATADKQPSSPAPAAKAAP